VNPRATLARLAYEQTTARRVRDVTETALTNRSPR
jgi:hypothetical protein